MTCSICNFSNNIFDAALRWSHICSLQVFVSQAEGQERVDDVASSVKCIKHIMHIQVESKYGFFYILNIISVELSFFF